MKKEKDNILNHVNESDQDIKEAHKIAEEAEGGLRHIEKGWSKWLIPVIAASWSIFQLLISSVLLLNSTVVRAAHLGFAICLVYLSYPTLKKAGKSKITKYLSVKDRLTILDIFLAILATIAALYIAIDYTGISYRQGIPLTRDIVMGILLLILLLEAARRSLGPVLPIVAIVFIIYSFVGPYMPSVFAYKGASLNRLIGQLTMSTEGVYGIPLDVSANVVFLFVLFGAMLEKAGAGRYFVNLAFSLLGRFKGGPAKAAVLASGLTGMVSGSSIANTVTTGTFTIPLMKDVGYPPHKAAAVEVACSTNGQLMPPIMGAAAFIIAEYAGVPYFEVVKAAFIPAVASYIALMYITHLEASKLGLKGIPKEQLPKFWPTFVEGIHFLLPLVALIVELVVFRHSPRLAAFNAIAVLAALMVVQNIVVAVRAKEGFLKGAWDGIKQILAALVAGGKNMMGIGVAVAAAGIIVGVVTLGLGGIITEIIEVLSMGNFLLMLIITAIASLILGMGLPTTATYIVMASLTAPVILTLGQNSGVEVPLIAAHLFVFFFGILADDTPPVGLAAFAASAIAKSDPIKTGVQGFTYDIRTAILPFMFIFNTNLLLIGIDNIWYAMWIFVATVFAMFAFAALTQGYFTCKNTWYDGVILAAVAFSLLRSDLLVEWLGGSVSDVFLNVISIAVFVGLYVVQKKRVNQPILRGRSLGV